MARRRVRRCLLCSIPCLAIALIFAPRARRDAASAPLIPEIRVITGRRGLTRCLELVDAVSSRSDEISLGDSRVSFTVHVVKPKTSWPWGGEALFEAYAGRVLALVVHRLGIRRAELRLVDETDLRPIAAREAWARRAPALLVLAGVRTREEVLSLEADMNETIDTLVTWARVEDI